MVRKEFGNVVPEEYIVSVKGVEVDLSQITTRMAIKYQAMLKDLGHTPNEEESIDLVAALCQMKNPDFTKDLIMDLDAKTELVPFIEFVMGALKMDQDATTSAIPTGADTKNIEP